VIVLGGLYSGRPELADLIDLSVIVVAPTAVRRQRHDKREATDQAQWHRRWDEAEDYYFAHVRPSQSYDLVIHTGLASP
jgi:uridine kinase